MKIVSFTKDEYQKISSVINKNLTDKEKAYEIIKYVDCKKIIDVIENRRKGRYFISGLPSEYQETYRKLEELYDKGVFAFTFYKGPVYRDCKNKIKMNIQEVSNRLEAINKIYNVINSNDSDYDIIYIIFYYFETYDDFKKGYTYIRNKKDDPEFKYALDALNNLDNIYTRCEKAYNNVEISGPAKKAARRDFRNTKSGIMNDYAEAKKVIESYFLLINTKDFVNVKDLNITITQFNKYVLVIKKTDDDLYKKYLQMEQIRKQKETYYYVNAFDNIAFKIKNTDYHFVNFLCDIPVEHFECDWSKHLKKKFNILEYDPLNAKIINDYIIENKLTNTSNISRAIKIKTDCCIVNNVVINESVINGIFDYMVDSNIKQLDLIYNYLKRQYINGQLDLSNYLDNGLSIKKTK